MRPLLFFILFSTACFSQNEKGSIGLQLGYDFYEVNEQGWNIGAIAKLNFKKKPRLFHEYLINYSEIEFNTKRGRLDPKDYQNPSMYQGHAFLGNNIMYVKQNIIRFQAGIGVTLWEKNKHQLSVSWNLATSLLTREKGNGEYVSFPYQSQPSSSPQIREYSYEDRDLESNYYLEFVPNICYSSQLSEHITLSARASALLPIINNDLNGIHTRLNLGIHYEF